MQENWKSIENYLWNFLSQHYSQWWWCFSYTNSSFERTTSLCPSDTNSDDSLTLMFIIIRNNATPWWYTLALDILQIFLSKDVMWCHLYGVFTYTYSLLTEKDLCECWNVSVKFPCALLFICAFDKSFPFLFLFSFQCGFFKFLVIEFWKLFDSEVVRSSPGQLVVNSVWGHMN